MPRERSVGRGKRRVVVSDLVRPQQRAAVYALKRVRAAKTPAEVTTKRGRRKDRQITVSAVVRPEPDVKKLAQALLLFAKEQQAAELRRLADEELGEPPAA